ncbi:MAG: hypothetical protein HQ541_09435 [Mariniphaga sp.]|nr:hypothetical protein [Mariniphaga sp.]
MNYTFHSDTGLEQIEKVKQELSLPGFDNDEFLAEVDLLIQEREHKLARLILQLAKTKLKNTPEDAGFGDGIRNEFLDDIEETIFEIEFDYEDYFNMDFNEEEEPETLFPLSLNGEIGMINIGDLKVFYSIEWRLVKEGYFNKYGRWAGQKEALIFLIDKLDLNGFFKRRTPKGRWYCMADYRSFFEWRYAVNLGKYFNFGEIGKIEDKDYLPWLQKYLG